MSVSQIKPTIFFIHGTYLPLLTPMLRLDCKEGISHPREYDLKYVLPHVAYVLDAQDPDLFPLQSFYLFGWSGKLSIRARKQAARELYAILKKYPHPITLICHSHGCNVALYLAAIAQEEQDLDFSVDTLILLAGPVQEATKKYIASPVFKEIVSFYSEGDMIQVIDPQGLQGEPSLPLLKGNPLFSQRLWPDAPNMVQVRVLFDEVDAWHLEFILDKFMNALPAMLKFLVIEKKRLNSRYYSVNINTQLETIKFCEIS